MPSLQHFELHVLLAMLLQQGETYSVPLVLELERRTGRPVSQAAVFITLGRLEKKGLVVSRLEEPAGGRTRRYSSSPAPGSWPSRSNGSNTCGCGGASTGSSKSPGTDMGRWLRWLVREADHRAIESDLSELYEFRRRRDGDRAAAKWLRAQQRQYPVRLLAERLRAVPGRGRTVMTHFWRDLIYSARSLMRAPMLTATIVLTIGVGLGATTGMLGVIRAVLLNPLLYADADEIYWIYTDNAPFRFRFSVVDYRAFEADHPAFSEIAAYQNSRVTVTEGGQSERVLIRSVTGLYFPLLGQRPRFGRLFEPADDSGGDRLAVLTTPYWTRRFGADPAVIGRSMTVDGARYTIVGVLEPASGPLERDVAFFTAARWPVPKRKGPFFTMAIARLRSDVAPAAALETLRATNARLFPIWKSSYRTRRRPGACRI